MDSSKSLKAWFDTERRYAEELATDPQFVKLAVRQLGISRNRDALMASKSFAELRVLLASNIYLGATPWT